MTEKRLALLIGLLVLAAVLVPYTLLRDVERLTGAFLFWTLFTLVVIFLIVRATAGWSRHR